VLCHKFIFVVTMTKIKDMESIGSAPNFRDQGNFRPVKTHTADLSVHVATETPVMHVSANNISPFLFWRRWQHSLRR